jgi:hypothetical protein
MLIIALDISEWVERSPLLPVRLSITSLVVTLGSSLGISNLWCNARHFYGKLLGQIRLHCFPSADRPYLWSSPVVYAVDGLQILTKLACLIFLGSSFSEALARIAERFQDVQEGEENSLRTLQQHTLQRLIVFGIGSTVQVVRSYASSVIPWTQTWAPMFQPSWVITELALLTKRGTSLQSQLSTRSCPIRGFETFQQSLPVFWQPSLRGVLTEVPTHFGAFLFAHSFGRRTNLAIFFTQSRPGDELPSVSSDQLYGRGRRREGSSGSAESVPFPYPCWGS